VDDPAFDRLAKVVATRQNRRSLVKGLLGLGGAAAIGGTDSDDPASAQISGPLPDITPIAICPPFRRCGADCCGLSETCCNGVCCTRGEQCCDPPGLAAPICLPEDACCTDADCTDFDDPANCKAGACNQKTHKCRAVDTCRADGLACCPGRTEGTCYDPAVECCPTCESGSCQTCVDGRCTGCEEPESCCVIGDFEGCLDLTVENSCCTSADCDFDDPAICQVSVCRDFKCEPASYCDVDDQCCAGLCIPGDAACPCSDLHPCPDGQLCCADGSCQESCDVACTSDSQCGPCETCLKGNCEPGCPEPQTCCVIGDFSICLDLTVRNSCCTADTCGLEDPDRCIVSACTDFTCQPFEECVAGQQCCGNHTCIDSNDTCV
jgi:hypothetical protein